MRLCAKRVIAGYVITCVGDPGPYSYLESRLGNTLTDRVVAHVFKHTEHPPNGIVGAIVAAMKGNIAGQELICLLAL